MSSVKEFPVVKAKSLSGKELCFPDVIKGKVTLVAVAFVRGAQFMLDTWTVPFEEACREDGVYEVPMIQGSLWKVFSGFIDSGMRSGIPEKKHDNVATYYGDTTEIRNKLGIKDISLGYVYLVDEEGKIIFEGSGYAKDDDIRKMLKKAGTSCSI
jgi:acyl-CoA hydrolase